MTDGNRLIIEKRNNDFRSKGCFSAVRHVCGLSSGVTKFGSAGQEDVRAMLELGLDLPVWEIADASSTSGFAPAAGTPDPRKSGLVTESVMIERMP